MTTSQILTVVILAILLLLILPMYKSRTGRDFSEVLIGKLKKEPLGADKGPQREPHLNNGTAGDLRYFLSSLISVALKKKMKVVAPGRIRYKGKTAEVTAFLVHKSGITGILCLGYNGSIRPAEADGSKWTQHMNGQDIPFDDPLSVRQKCYDIVKPALEGAGIDAPLDFVTVFTTNGVKLDYRIASMEGIFYRNRYIDHIRRNADTLNTGTLDVFDTAARLAKLAGIDELKKQEKEKKSRS